MGRGHLDKFRAWTENRKTRFPGARGPETEKKVTRLSEMVVCNFSQFTFWPTGPPRAGKREIRGFWAILAQAGRWHLEKSWAWAENGKLQFPGARGPEMKKHATTVSRMVFRNFLAFYVLADRTPTGGKSQNRGFLGHLFWPRTALGTQRNPGPGPKSEKHKFPVQGVRKRKKRLPRYPGWLSATFLCFTFWPT